MTAKISNIEELIFPEVLPTIEEIENKYPPRNLKPGSMVTRIAPSPTGFMHIGGLYTALICERLAHQSEGVFYLRIEDTDKKREVAGATELVVESLERYHINIDEGLLLSGEEKGEYGPYKQSERSLIYKTYVKELLRQNLAYPCFCTHDELEAMRKTQEEQEIRPGYYRDWAKCRHLSTEETKRALEEKKPYVIRLRSSGDFNKKIIVNDILKGQRELSENDQDIVIMKSDGLPTYHMAHVVDDHLMKTTHVIRGDEWFSSLTLHLQLFDMLNFERPQFAHISPIQKTEGVSRRKLSKRKDPEASVAYYDENGYPEESVIEYLLNLANSNFEDWHRENPSKHYTEFTLKLAKMSHSGALFDFVKLDNISKDVVARFSAQEIYDRGLTWAGKYDQELKEILEENPAYVLDILNIERTNTNKIRKDIAKWSDLKTELKYFFDSHFSLSTAEALALLPGLTLENIKAVANSYIETYNEQDTNEEWFAKIKLVGVKHGFAENIKDYKAAPDKYQGNIADVAKIIRILVTGRAQTPNLHDIMQVMKSEMVLKRLSIFN